MLHRNAGFYPTSAQHGVANVRTASCCSSGYYTESNNVTRESLNFEHIKCILLGDGAVGKTSLIISYTTNGYPCDYIPTTFDTFKVDVKVEDKPVHLEICDTAGQEDFDALRPLCYPQADCFVLCFSVVSPSSFANIRHKWFPELRKFGPASVPIILVGTQSDLRDDVKISIDLAKSGEKPLSESQISELCRSINAIAYIECSALTSKNLKTVFDTVLLAALDNLSSREGRFRSKLQNSSRPPVSKKRSQSTSSTATSVNDVNISEKVGMKLSASSSCTSPPFVVSEKKSTEGTPRLNRSTINESHRSGFACSSLEKSLPLSPPQKSRQKFRCCF